MSAVKHDEGKPELALISSDFIEELGLVLSHGKTKYGSHNWRSGFAYSRTASAALRHLFSWISGQDKDPESGLSHLAHCACNIMFLVEFQRRGKGEDDRFKY